MNRTSHYQEAERLAEEAVQKMASAERYAGAQRAARDDAHMLLRAALIHATLATAVVEPETAQAQTDEQPTQDRTMTMAEVAKALRPKPGPPRPIRVARES